MAAKEYKRSEIVSGLFVTVAAVIFALFAFRVGGFNPLWFLKAEPVVCAADLTNVTGLVPGSKVAVGGASVGEVTQLRLVDRPVSDAQRRRLVELFGEDRFGALDAGMTRQVVEVRFAVYDHNLRVDVTTARVSVASDGLLGQNYLALDPGFWRGDKETFLALRPDEPVVIAAVESSGLSDLLARVGPAVRRVDALLARIDSEIMSSDNMDSLASTLRSLDDAAAEVRAFISEDAPNGLHELVVRPLNEVLLNADESMTALRERLLDRTLVEAEKLMEDGSRMTTSVEKFANHADEMLVEMRPQVEQALDDLASAARQLEESIGEIATEAEIAISTASDLLTENRAGLAETVRRLRRTMFEAELAMRKIRANPAYILFGDDEVLLDAPDFDETGLRRTGRVGPFEQRDEQ